MAAAFNPRLLVIAGTVNMSCSSLFVALAATTPATSTLFRCVLALPLLLPLAIWEWRKQGVSRRWAADLGAGALLGGDFVLWTQSIADVGAGIATVLVNVQVIVVPLLARLTGERMGRRYLLVAPVAITGLVFASGLTSPGEHTVRGTLCALAAGVCYSGYLLIMRTSGQRGGKFAPVTTATIGTSAVALLVGLGTGSLVTPELPSFGWLAALAVTGQVLGWLLVLAGMPHLPAATGAVLLLMQPVLAVGWAALVLGQYPSPVQLSGCAVVIAALWLASARPSRPRRVSQPAAAGVGG